MAGSYQAGALCNDKLSFRNEFTDVDFFNEGLLNVVVLLNKLAHYPRKSAGYVFRPYFKSTAFRNFLRCSVISGTGKI